MTKEKSEKYYVSLNSRKAIEVKTIEEAWEVIGAAPFGTCYTIRDKNKDIVPETVPF